MTCDAFKTALWGAIDNAGNRVATPDLETVGYAADDVVRIDMKGIVGLDGSLRCRKTLGMESFDAATDITEDEGTIRMIRIEALAAATICAVESAMKAEGCKRMAAQLAGQAVNAYKRSYVRGETDPMGDSDRKDFANGYVIQFNAVPGNMAFTLTAPY
jgi:hypothetical protein